MSQSTRSMVVDRSCPECNADFLILRQDRVFPLPCKRCGENTKLISCRENSCRFHKLICCHCEEPYLEGQPKINNESLLRSTSSRNDLSHCWWFAGFGLILVIALFICHGESTEDGDVILIKSLKKDFPSQRNETWFHFLSVLEKKVPSVKSITFLHGEDKRTSDCLIKKLVSLYSENKTIKTEEITFSLVGYEGVDYGFALEHYRLIVDTFRVFVTDLMKVPGSIARIFHSLCDEVSSDIKPSLFIFALKFDKRMEKLKPVERAETILRENWSDLPENEMSPLLSRIIRNVVDIVPERETTCN